MRYLPCIIIYYRLEDEDKDNITEFLEEYLGVVMTAVDRNVLHKLNRLLSPILF